MSSQADSDSLIEDRAVPSDATSSSLSNVRKIRQHTTKHDAESPVPKASGESSPEGSECAVQVLYEGPPTCKCCKNWVEEYPDDLRQQVEDQPEIKQKAFIKRMRKNHSDGKALVLDSIVVQSPSLKKTLGEVFQGYKGITASLKNVVFKAPFHPFYYRWRVFTEIVERQRLEDPTAFLFSVLLYNELQKELGDVMAEIDDHFQHGVITYTLLWALFEPGTLIVSSRHGHEHFYIVQDCVYSEDGFFAITAHCVDWNGKRFGYSNQRPIISKYSGTQDIASLGTYPAKFHPTLAEARAKAIERGKKFIALHGFQYKAYSGLAWVKHGKKEFGRNVDGRIIIDAASYLHAKPEDAPNLKDLDSSSIAPKMDVEDEKHGRTMVAPMGEARTRTSLRRLARLGIEETEGKNPISFTIDDFTEEQLLLCDTRVRGYSLKLKIWAFFDVTKVFDIVWNDNAFPRLMLPDGYQNLILSFVEAQSDKGLAFDDIIEGKGMGMIMLLAGSPGTGKTLTAEAIADKVRKPLYLISAGELGQSASSVEKRLTEVLELAEKWDAVLLFDECDVFMQERSVNNMAHNEIVAVFLRLLEYYRGIMLMTTNRSDAIDRAFQSRIHLTLHYPDLDATAKGQIWRQFVAQVNHDTTFTDDLYSRLAGLPMNGRQIKNTVKISALLAHKEKAKLSMRHVQTVLRATREANGQEI